MIRILTKRVQAKTEAIGGLGDDQFGFRKGMGTRDAIGTLRGVYRMVRMYISALWIMKKHLIGSNGEGYTTCTETDGNRLERQKTNRKPVHGAANASKNRWRVLGTGEGGQRCETGMPAFATTI